MSAQALLQPVMVGPYRLTSRVATGGMAEIYAGRHVTADGQLGGLVAVKRLLPHLAKDSAVVRMFLNEARITSQLKHPNVVRVFELGQADGEPFIAMELLEGHTFADLRSQAAERGKRVPLPVALRILREASHGLDAAHRAVDDQGRPLALVHRDFTPDNIHVGSDGAVKVIDFGIARTGVWSSGTEPGTLKGKFFYMSPEMIRGQAVDHRADIFAAGVMLYEQMCGRRPFTGNDAEEVMRRIAAGQLTPPSQFDPSVPKGLEAVCLRALAADPQRRFDTLLDFADAIDRSGAEIADLRGVAGYQAAAFPAATDEVREALRIARAADPSIPNMPAVAEPPPDQVAAPGPAAAPPQPAPGPKPRRVGLGAIVGALLGIAALAGGVVAFLNARQPADPDQLLAEARAATTPKDREAALERLAGSVAATPAQLEPAAQLAVEQGQWEVAGALADAWLAKAPTSGEAKLVEGRAAAAQRKARRAEGALKDAAKALPDARPELALAALYEAQGDAPQALAAYTRAADRPRGEAALGKKGYLLSQAGRLPEAEVALRQALDKRYDAELEAELGFVLLRAQKGDAVRVLQRAVQRAPESGVAQYYLASARYQKGDVAQAREGFRAADERLGEDPRALVAWCELEQQQGGAGTAAVKQRMQARFPKQAAALIAACDSVTAP